MNPTDTKRRRSVPAWMKAKAPQPQPQQAAPAQPEVVPKAKIKTKSKSKRPDYPGIKLEIKKAKRLPKRTRIPPTKLKVESQSEGSPTPGPSSRASQGNQDAEEDALNVEDYIMTVEELTEVAMEIVEEEHRLRAARRKHAESLKSKEEWR